MPKNNKSGTGKLDHCSKRYLKENVEVCGAWCVESNTFQFHMFGQAAFLGSCQLLWE